MDSCGTYFTHVQTCDYIRVQSATEWTYSTTIPRVQTRSLTACTDEAPDRVYRRGRSPWPCLFDPWQPCSFDPWPCLAAAAVGCGGGGANALVARNALHVSTWRSFVVVVVVVVVLVVVLGCCVPSFCCCCCCCRWLWWWWWYVLGGYRGANALFARNPFQMSTWRSVVVVVVAAAAAGGCGGGACWGLP